MTSIEKETLLNILDMYKDMPYLWDKNHKEYKNKSLRNDGYKVLLEIFKNFDPAATMKTLKKRIENMKAAYFREEKKVKSSKHTGAGSEDLHVPTLWYFDAFSFLGSTTEPCRPVNDSLGNENADSSLSDDETQTSQPGPTNAGSVPAKKKKKTLFQKQENILNMAEKVLAKKEEDWECLGRSIGLQLRDLNEKSLTIVQKLIADAIYYAKIGRLTEDSYIVLGSNPIRPISSHQISTHLRCRSSLSLHSPSPPLYSDASSSPSSVNPLPSHQTNRIQLSCASPQYQNHLPKQSPQYQAQLPSQSPQYQAQLPSQSPQYQAQLPSQSPQYQAQLPSQSPQYQAQLPSQSPQYQAQLPSQSPQYQAQLPSQSPQYRVHLPSQSSQCQAQLPSQSPQYRVHLPSQSSQCQVQLPKQSQYQVQLPSQSPLYQVQLDESSGNYQLHIPEPSQDPTNTTGTVINEEENDLSPIASSNILIRGTEKDMKDFLIFKKNK